MGQAVTFRCPNCNGVVGFDVDSGLATCAHCGATFEPGELGIELPLAGDVAEEAPGAPDAHAHAETVAEFMERAPWSEPSEGAAGVRAYSCPGCAARVLAYEATVSTRCPYCGNNLLVAAAKSEDLVPRYVIPFAVTKTRAKEVLQKHLASVDKAYLPKDFEPELEHVRGVYVPYYLFDLRVEGEVGAACEWFGKRGRSSRTYYYAARAYGTGTFVQVPLDASSRMPDAHMDAVAPFDLERLEPFSPGLLAGYLAEVPDEGEESLRRRAEALARASMVEQGSGALEAAYPWLTEVGEAVHRWSDARVERCVLCSLPVWLLHCRWRGEDLLFAVNGQTGECVGDMPVDEGRRRRRRRADVLPFALVPVLLLACLVLLSATSGGPRSGVEALSLLLLIGQLFLIPYLDKIKKAALRDDEARLRQVRSARRAETSMENQARANVAFRRFCIYSAPNALEAKKAVVACQGRPDSQKTQMTQYARDVFGGLAFVNADGEVWLRVADESRNPEPFPWSVPFDQDVVAIHNDTDSLGAEYGYAVMGDGLYCRTYADTAWKLMDWQRFAVTYDLRIRGASIVCDGMVLAYDVPEPMRKRMLYLYQRLWVIARGVYGSAGELDEEVDRHNRLHTRTMSNLQSACKDFYIWPKYTFFRWTNNSRRDLSVRANDEVWLGHINIRQGHPQRGFAITSRGIYCRELREWKAHFVSWKDLRKLSEPKLDGTSVIASTSRDNVTLMCYEGEQKMREELLELCRKLWRIARDYEWECKHSERVTPPQSANPAKNAITETVQSSTAVSAKKGDG